jgi:hypothetical protein
MERGTPEEVHSRLRVAQRRISDEPRKRRNTRASKSLSRFNRAFRQITGQSPWDVSAITADGRLRFLPARSAQPFQDDAEQVAGASAIL